MSKFVLKRSMREERREDRKGEQNVVASIREERRITRVDMSVVLMGRCGRKVSVKKKFEMCACFFLNDVSLLYACCVPVVCLMNACCVPDVCLINQMFTWLPVVCLFCLMCD